MSIRNKPRDAAVLGIDMGKTVFHVVGLDAAHAPIQKATFRRETLLQFFERASTVLIRMEACPGSQWLARKLQAMGHTVRIVPAQFVKPFGKSNKNDIIAAEAIAEAVTTPTMRFVEIGSPEQIDLQALQRVRDRMIAHCTRLISQMRAFCLEYGIAIHQGAGKFKADMPRVLPNMNNELTRGMLTEVFGEFGDLEQRIAAKN
ncbi:transposase [Sphingobium xenophagum]|nr:transposase [Sphingobium xenophagum]QWT14406.1 transposase [Sphingobium xenophagum]